MAVPDRRRRRGDRRRCWYDFRALRSRGREAVLIAFDLLEDDGSDLHDLSLVERKRRLARLISKAKKRNAIQ